MLDCGNGGLLGSSGASPRLLGRRCGTCVFGGAAVMAAKALVAVGAAFVVTTSCSLDWSVPGARDAGAADAHDDAVADAANVDAPSSIPPGQPDGTTGVKPGSPCSPSSVCESQDIRYVCIFAALDCGAQSAGSCVAALSPGGDANDPNCTRGGSYCGCDGQLYASSCDPQRKGFDLAPIKTCSGVPPTDGTQAGYASCPSPLVMVEDPSRPHTAVYRCADAMGCSGDCQCLLKLCAKPGGKCSTATHVVCP